MNENSTKKTEHHSTMEGDGSVSVCKKRHRTLLFL